MIHWPTVSISVFNSGVAGLNSLLREWDIAATDGVQIRFWCFVRNLQHDNFPLRWCPISIIRQGTRPEFIYG